ncbi:MAG: Nramp family divalent metal transporter [Nakamurella sp.]
MELTERSPTLAPRGRYGTAGSRASCWPEKISGRPIRRTDCPELCREHFDRPVSIGLRAQAELIAMATDLAELVGAAVGLNLLFNVPLLPAGLITVVIAFVILTLEQRGYRRFELAIIALLAIVFLGFLYDLFLVGASVPAPSAG